MSTAPQPREDARSAFHRELHEATRSTAILAGSLGTVLTLGWTALDRVLEPVNADAFLLARIAVVAFVAAVMVLIVLGVVRGVVLEWASFATFAVLQVAIAWMVPRVVDSFEVYLLGLSLPMYASAILVVWRWRFTALLALVTGAALTVFSAIAPSTTTVRQAIVAGFYLGTASILSIVAQYLRNQSAWREFQAREALADEQRRSSLLLADLARLSREDDLTGLVNRRGWQEALTAAYTAGRRRGGDLAVVLCDLDHFKRINDEHGHATGDEVLRRMAALLRAAVRETDTVARLGGDEFGILLPRTDHATAAEIAVRIVAGARGLELRELGVPGVTVSVGVAMLEGDDADTEALVHRADVEMYRAKAERDAAWMSGVRRGVTVGQG